MTRVHPLPGGCFLDADALAAVRTLARWYLAGGASPPSPSRAGERLLLELRDAWPMSDLGHSLEASAPANAGSPQPADQITISDVAKEFGVDPRTAGRWAEAGDLGEVAYAGRTRLVNRSAVETFKRERGTTT